MYPHLPAKLRPPPEAMAKEQRQLYAAFNDIAALAPPPATGVAAGQDDEGESAGLVRRWVAPLPRIRGVGAALGFGVCVGHCEGVYAGLCGQGWGGMVTAIAAAVALAAGYSRVVGSVVGVAGTRTMHCKLVVAIPRLHLVWYACFMVIWWWQRCLHCATYVMLVMCRLCSECSVACC